MSEVVTAKKSPNKMILLAVAAVVVLAGLFFFLRSGDSLTEEMVVKRVKEELALINPIVDLKVEAVSADVSKREVTYTNLSFVFPDIPEITVTIDKVVQTGIDEASYAGTPGDLTTIDVQTLQGMKVLAENQPIMTIDEYIYDGFKLNYRDLLTLLRENQTASMESIVPKLLPIWATYHLDNALIKNLKFQYEIVEAGIDSMEAADISVTACGAWSLNNMTMNVMGTQVFSMEKMGGVSMLLPQVLADIMADPEGYMQKNPAVMQQLNTDPLAVFVPLQLKGMYIDNMMVNTGSQVTLKKLTADLDISETALVIKSSVTDLLISRDLLLMHPDLMELSDVITSDMHLNSVFDFSLSNNADPVDIAMRVSLNESSLGGGDMSIAMDTPKSDLYGNTESGLQRLKSFELSAENKGIIDFVVACYAASEYLDYNAVYEEMLAELYSGVETAEGRVQKDAAEAMIKLVENGGTLTMTLKPSTPVLLESLDAMSDEEFAKVGSVTYTPLESNQ